MWKFDLLFGFCLGFLMFPLAEGDILKVVSLYGKNTEKDDIYKQTMSDASTYINDGRSTERIIRSGDQVNVIHQRLLEDREYERQTLSKSVYQICNEIRSIEAMAIILPNDFCEECDDVGAVIGEAYSPVITLDQADGSGAFKMRPNLEDMEEMIVDVIDHFRWKTFILLYEGGAGHAMAESISSKAISHGWTVTAIEMDEDFKVQAEWLKTKRTKNILLYVTNDEVLSYVVKTAFDTQLLSNGWHWMFGNLNPPISKGFLEQKYRHNMAFLTRFKVDGNDLAYHTTIPTPIKHWRFRQRAAYDALVAVAKAMDLHVQREGHYPASIPVCGSNLKSTLEPYLKQIRFKGASGDVSFNDAGDRINYTINIYSGKDMFANNKAGFFTQDIKRWEYSHGEKWQGNQGKRTFMYPFRQSDARYIKILAVPEPPFFMQKGWEGVRYPKDRIKYEHRDTYNEEPYEGYSWELIKQVKQVFEEEMGIDFQFHVTMMSRGQYGSLDLSTGEWNGMIRELIDGDADVAIGSLTKNGAREKDIDFTAPWYKSQLKVVILHPSWTFEYPFAMVYPLHITAWAALGTLFVIVVLVVYMLGYCSPYEYRRLAQRGQASEEEANTFSFLESVFYCLSTGFWQGFNRGPRSWSLRTLSVFWFWFSICTIFLYAWNVNAVFKFSKTGMKIKDVHNLLYNDVYEFGAVRGSPAYDFYRYNKGQYRMVFDRILNSEKKLLEERIEQAVYRIRRQWNGRYAVLGEERILSYAADRKPCRLFVTGKTLGKLTFAFATPSGSPLRDQLSYALKLLKKRGNISRILENKYSDRLQCAGVSDYEKVTKKSFTIHDFQGMYYVMFMAMSGSVIVFILEWLVYVLIVDKGRRPSFAGRRPGVSNPQNNVMGTDYYVTEQGGSGLAEGSPTDWI